MVPDLPVLLALAALIGACVGSFINLVVWRLPRGESVITPRSHCPRCGSTLAWSELVPVLSFVLLGRRCAHCDQPIPWRYPLVELLSSFLWMAMVIAHPPLPGGPSVLTVVAGWLLVSWLLPLVLIDLDRLWLPEPLCRWGLLLGMVITAAIACLQTEVAAGTVVLDHLLAAAAGLVSMEALSGLGRLWLARPALGLGDAKLAALLGAWLGLTGLALTLALAILLGALVGSLARLAGRLQPYQPFAFGPFLATGGVVIWLGGVDPLVSRLAPLLGFGPGV
jgi:leader peptidase (prepilin peptidase)/N-methyltransferase